MPHQCTQCGTTFADGSKEMLSGCPDCGNNKFQYQPGDVDDSGARSGGTDAPTGSNDAATTEDAATTDATTNDPPTADAPPDRDGGGVTDRVNRATKTVKEWVGTDRDDGGDRAGAGTADAASADDAPAATTEAATAPEAAAGDAEDTAQASARSDVVDPDELPERGPAPEATDATDAPTAESSTPEATGGESSAASAGPETAPSPEESAATADEAGGTAAAGTEAAGTESSAPDAREPTPEGQEPADDENVVEAPDDDTPDLDELREELNQQFESIKIVEPGQYELNLMELYDRQEYIISLKEDGRYAIEVPETWRDDDA